MSMSIYTLFGISLALAMDAFTVTFGVSLTGKVADIKKILRLSITFGLFQFIMPVIGFYIGTRFVEYYREIGHWVGFGLLFLIGSKMIYDSYRRYDISMGTKDPTTGIRLIGLSIGTSIDAFSMGVTFSAFGQSILFPAILIGAVTMIVCFIGGILAPVIGRRLGRISGVVGGLLLIGIGFILLFEHI